MKEETLPSITHLDQINFSKSLTEAGQKSDLVYQLYDIVTFFMTSDSTKAISTLLSIHYSLQSIHPEIFQKTWHHIICVMIGTSVKLLHDRPFYSNFCGF